MKITHAVMLAALIAAPALAADRASAEKALVANETKIIDAVVKGDAAGFTKMAAPGSVSADGNGFAPSVDFAKILPQVKITEAKMTGEKVIWADDNTAILTYTLTAKGTIMGQPMPPTTYASTVWVKQGEEWLALYHQETTAAPGTLPSASPSATGQPR